MFSASLGLALALIADSYVTEPVEGFTIKIEAKLASPIDPLWASVRQELSTQLYRISHVVADAPLAKLRKVTVWVHKEAPVTKCMAYHPSSKYLKEHQMNLDMAKGIEIGNAQAFVSWTYEQPWMVLHELAHAYHDQFLEGGFEHKPVKDIFVSATQSKTYNSILHWDGKPAKHYALTNQMEYFAEATEAYFGQNDFHPFVRAELMQFDPKGYELMNSIWGQAQKRL